MTITDYTPAAEKHFNYVSIRFSGKEGTLRIWLMRAEQTFHPRKTKEYYSKFIICLYRKVHITNLLSELSISLEIVNQYCTKKPEQFLVKVK